VFFVGNLVVLSLWLTNSDNGSQTGQFENKNKEKLKAQWKQRFMQKLDLDDAQFDEFERLRNQHIKAIFTCQKQIDSLKEGLMDQTFTKSSDSAVVHVNITEIAELQKEIEFLNFNHYRKIRSVCRNEEQREKLDQTFRHWIENPPGRHRRGRGPH